MGEKEFKQALVANPLKFYFEFRARLLQFGQMASFPEFKYSVDFIMKELRSDEVQKAVIEHPALALELKEVRNFLFHCNLEFKKEDGIDYPYDIPYNGPYPYRPTIEAIESAIRFFDKVCRLSKDSKAVKLYHFDRYCYHKHQLITDTNNILLPLATDLSFTDFIRTRSVPINFIGVVSKTLRVDGHYQSPLDFWYHDMNHARRLYAYVKRRNRGLDEREINKLYYENNTFINEIVLPYFVEITNKMTDEEAELRKMCSIIVFEIMHETALNLDRESLIADLLRPNGPQPFEVMSDIDLEEIENLRTPTGNLQSGAANNQKAYFPNFSKPTRVNYFLDKTSIGLLANIYSKLNHNYYDGSETIRDNVVKAEYRTPEFILRAVKYILATLNYNEAISDKQIINLILNRDGIKERILHTPLNNDAGVFISQESTDPLYADEIIERIQEKYEYVYTLFGYSALGYASPTKMLESVRKDLSELDNKKVAICIGATEEGIGAAYKLAKDMGFKTLGIVSTQALSYSGRFSDFVDSIYIVNDELWGGYIPGTAKLAETTRAFLGASNFISAYGGGQNTKMTLKAAKELGIPNKSTPFRSQKRL